MTSIISILPTVLYIILAFLGIGIIIFFHELGHYWMARREGMKVEVFSIGFGKAIYSWKRGSVKWQIGILPFGGYVKIHGMQSEKGKDIYDMENGFFGKKPWARIKVCFMGPMANFILAFVAFLIIFAFGGRDSTFSEHTNKIGFVKSPSALKTLGLKEGDEILELDHHKYRSFQDLIRASVLSHGIDNLKGCHINYLTQNKDCFDLNLAPFADSQNKKKKYFAERDLLPARYLLIADDKMLDGPMKDSGLQVNDRILWADGEIVFSVPQLSRLINEKTAYLTIKRDNEIFQVKLDKIKVQDLKISNLEKEEIDDWSHAAKLHNKVEDLLLIPYFFDENCLVLKKLDQEGQGPNQALKAGDKILAISGEKVLNARELLAKLQTKKVLVIVQRDKKLFDIVSTKVQDKDFANQINGTDVGQIISSIGTDKPLFEVNNYHLLNSVTPQMIKEITSLHFIDALKKNQEMLSKLKDSKEKEEIIKNFEQELNKFSLGITSDELTDKTVKYNPNPFSLFKDVWDDTIKTLGALFTGTVSPKQLMGPVGIISIVQSRISLGFLESLYWIGLISINLGVLNLLPIPGLDGGYVALSFYEMITRKKIKAKSMEKLILPFIILLIIFFIVVTYSDIIRLFTGFFR
ncbi:MAG: site-2 protease family protein [Chlamydiae bacterium]|nr:site-2 protease family protein [Chlamydiota bacterium]